MTKPRVSILERPVYGISEAAGLLGLRPDRARAWLDGYERQGAQYSPVIRVEPTGEDIVTWGEFVELGYLREYRRKGVPLQRLRPVIDELRRAFDTPYPLATAKPYVLDKELVLELQEKNDIPQAIAIVVRSGQQVLLAPGAERFFKKVEFDPPDEDDVRRLYPVGLASPVVIDPLVRFGRPCVRGVATERLWDSSTPANRSTRSPRATTWQASLSGRLSPTRSSCTRWRHSSSVVARFFVDENDLALGKALAELHVGDVVSPGHVSCPRFRGKARTTSGSR